MNKIIGIGLGTTNNHVAIMEGGKLAVIANTEGIRAIPSVVAFTKAGERLVGESVKRQTVVNADKTISSIKRHIGTGYRVSIDDKRYPPQEIFAIILRKLKADAESYLGEKVTEAVITAPVYFNDAQHQATEDAGKTAGPDVKRIISEPTATMLAYGLDNEKEQKVMVYGLGDGTFDVSIIETDDGVIEILSTNGDTRLSGDDFDNRITQWMVDDFKKTEGVDLSVGKMALQRLKEAAGKAKKELPTVTITNINLPFTITTAEEPKHLDMSLTRAKFDELTHDLAEKAAIPVQNALRDTGTTISELGKVLLVGGSAHTIAAREEVKQLTGQEPSKSPNPGECVAIGTAIQDSKLAGNAGAGDILLLDVTPLSLPIETMGGVATRLVERSTTIPTKRSQVFPTAADNQTAADAHVVRGEKQSVKDSKTLGQLRLDGIPPARRSVLQTEATFDIDANGIVNVSVKNLGTGKEQHIIITFGSNTSDDDIDKAVKEVTKFEVQDKRRKETIDARSDADSTVFQTKKTLEEISDKIDANDEAVVEADLSAPEGVINRAPLEEMTDVQVEDIRTDKEKLMTSAQALFIKVYRATREAGVVGAGPGVGADAIGGNQPGDDVVDGDFKEVQNTISGRYVPATW